MSIYLSEMRELGQDFWRVETGDGKILEDFQDKKEAECFYSELEVYYSEVYADNATEVF